MANLRALERRRAHAVLDRYEVDRWPADQRISRSRLTFLGAGLSRVAFACALEASGRREDVVVLLRRAHADEGSEVDARSRTQALLMRHLADETLSFDVPRALAVYDEDEGVALVNERVWGMPIDLRVKRTIGGKPWEIVGQIAAVIHGVDLDDWIDSDRLPGYETRRAHALGEIEIFDDLVDDHDELVPMREWAMAHLPDPSPARLLHGDLLGQNILMSWTDASMEEVHYTVIDWEFSIRGDPAYELAVITRGVRRPFQINNGFERLMRAYRQSGGWTLLASEVRLYELCLAAHWYRQALESLHYGVDSPDQALLKLRATFRRAVASTAS